jgi:hypothetical protein
MWKDGNDCRATAVAPLSTFWKKNADYQDAATRRRGAGFDLRPAFWPKSGFCNKMK